MPAGGVVATLAVGGALNRPPPPAGAPPQPDTPAIASAVAITIHRNLTFSMSWLPHWRGLWGPRSDAPRIGTDARTRSLRTPARTPRRDSMAVQHLACNTRCVPFGLFF